MEQNQKFEFSVDSLAELPGFSGYTYKAIKIYNVSSLDKPKNNTLMFCNKWNDEINNQLAHIKDCLILMNAKEDAVSEAILKNNQCFFTTSPRRDYAKLLSEILKSEKRLRKYNDLGKNIFIGENVVIGTHVKIEPGVFIEHDVIIGNGCIIQQGVRIDRFVTIGNWCTIGANSTLGGGGFGFERGEAHMIYRMPQLGGVLICNDVEIGVQNTISSGTMNPTLIDDHVKTDDLVHIGHNSHIGKGSIIAGFTMICGSVSIGKNVWIGPGCTLSDHISIGDEANIGIGSVLVESLPEGKSTGGYYAIDRSRSLKNYQRMKGF